MATSPLQNELSFDIDRADSTAALIRTLLDASPAGVLVVDAQGVIQLANVRAADLFGYEKDALTGTLIEERVPPPIRRRHVADRDAYFKSPEPRDLGKGRDLRAVRRDGTEFPAEVALTPLATADGVVAVCTVVDISERLRLDSRRRHLEAIVDSSTDAIISVNLHGKVESWNAEAARVFGWTAEEAHGRDLPLLSSPRAHIDYMKAAALVRRGMAPPPFRVTLKPGPKPELRLLVTVSPVADRNNDLVGFATIARDITELVSAERALDRSSKALDDRNQDLEHLACVVSHELKAPLHSIAAATRRLADALAGTAIADAQANMEQVVRNADRANQLTDRILQYFEALSADPQPGRIDTLKLVTDVIESIEVPHGTTIRVAGELPHLHYDESQLRQIFLNLLDNSVAHKIGRPAGNVVVSSRDAGDNWEFSIRSEAADTPRRGAPHAFETLQRLPPADDSIGPGIELAIVRRIVKRNDGRVWRIPTEGAGAEFVFTIPQNPST